MLKYSNIIPFFHTIAIIPMQAFYYAQIMASTSPHSSSSLPSLKVRMSLYVLMLVTVCSGFTQLTLANLFAATLWFVHVHCYYSVIMLQCYYYHYYSPIIVTSLDVINC